MVLIGYRHFDNIQTGMAAATLYLLLPYTAEYTPRVDHVVPAALLVWAVQWYRRPAVAGMLVGLAGGLTWYPLLPAAALVLVLLAAGPGSLRHRGGRRAPAVGRLARADLCQRGRISDAIAGHLRAAATGAGRLDRILGVPFLRVPLPVCAAFVAMCAGMAIWPAQKNLGTLLSCSAAVMVGARVLASLRRRHFMAWYLPLLILTIFRPNLEDRIARRAVSEGWGRGAAGNGIAAPTPRRSPGATVTNAPRRTPPGCVRGAARLQPRQHLLHRPPAQVAVGAGGSPGPDASALAGSRDRPGS